MNDIINRPYDQNALGSEENVENVNCILFIYLKENLMLY